MKLHAFGFLWLGAVLVCVAGAALLVLSTNRLHQVGMGAIRIPILGAAAFECFIVITDVMVRMAAASMHDAGLPVLDVWTIARPMLHAGTLALMALAVARIGR